MLMEIPSSPARALKRMCAVGRSTTPETAGAIRTKASSETSLLCKVPQVISQNHKDKRTKLNNTTMPKYNRKSLYHNITDLH